MHISHQLGYKGMPGAFGGCAGPPMPTSSDLSLRWDRKCYAGREHACPHVGSWFCGARKVPWVSGGTIAWHKGGIYKFGLISLTIVYLTFSHHVGDMEQQANIQQELP